MVNQRRASLRQKKSSSIEESYSPEKVRSLELKFRKNPEDNTQVVADLICSISKFSSTAPKVIHAVRRCFDLVESAESQNEDLQEWAKKSREAYATALVATVLNSNDNDVVNTAIASAALTNIDVWKTICAAVMESAKTSVQKLVFENFIHRFEDLRKSALELIAEQKGPTEVHLKILSACVDAETEAAKSSVPTKELRSAFVKAWLSILRRPLEQSTKTQVLQRIPKELLPVIPNPLQLADFFTSSFSTTHLSTSVASLDGLFVLVSKHGLDYPLFYQKVYGLLKEDVFSQIEARERFMQLVALFLLKGALLPGNMVAAFIKRLVRRALYWPPAVALWSLRLALDLMRKHPHTSILVHRTTNMFDDASNLQQDMEDPFDDNELDPQACRANESSLWELEVLRKHMIPAISRLVINFEKELTTSLPPPGDLSDYIGIGFKDLFQAEVHRKSKSSPLAYSAPGTDPSALRIKKRLRRCVTWV